MESDAEALLAALVVTAEVTADLVHQVRMAVDHRRVGPVYGEQCGDEPAVSHGALDRIVELAHLMHLTIEIARVLTVSVVIVEEGVIITDHVSSQVAQHEDITGITPRAVRGGELPLFVISSEGQTEIVDRLRHLTVAHSSSDSVGMQDKMELVVQDTGSLDAEISNLLHADILKVTESVKAAEIWGDQILLPQDLRFPFVESLCHAFLLVQPQPGEEDRVMFHVEELLVVGLESILKDSDRGHGLSINLMTDHVLSESEWVDAPNGDIFGLRIGFELVPISVLFSETACSNVAQIVIPLGDRSGRQRSSIQLSTRECLEEDIWVNGIGGGLRSRAVGNHLDDENGIGVLL